MPGTWLISRFSPCTPHEFPFGIAGFIRPFTNHPATAYRIIISLFGGSGKACDGHFAAYSIHISDSAD